jgi:hypothetical protein
LERDRERKREERSMADAADRKRERDREWARQRRAAQGAKPRAQYLAEAAAKAAERQAAIEEMRTSCKDIRSEKSEVTLSGDEGLIRFTLGSKPAVMIDDIMICGECYHGVSCTNRGTRNVEIYMLSGRTWTKVLSEEYFTGDIFVSVKPGQNTQELNALVGYLYIGKKDCPTREAPDASSQSREARTCVVRWQGNKFTYKPL